MHCAFTSAGFRPVNSDYIHLWGCNSCEKLGLPRTLNLLSSMSIVPRVRHIRFLEDRETMVGEVNVDLELSIGRYFSVLVDKGRLGRMDVSKIPYSFNSFLVYVCSLSTNKGLDHAIHFNSFLFMHHGIIMSHSGKILRISKFKILVVWLIFLIVLGRYICSTCGKAYKYSSSLYNHQTYECGKSPRFKCKDCSYAAHRKYTLQMHEMAIHHKMLE